MGFMTKGFGVHGCRAFISGVVEPVLSTKMQLSEVGVVGLV